MSHRLKLLNDKLENQLLNVFKTIVAIEKIEEENNEPSDLLSDEVTYIVHRIMVNIALRFKFEEIKGKDLEDEELEKISLELFNADMKHYKDNFALDLYAIKKRLEED